MEGGTPAWPSAAHTVGIRNAMSRATSRPMDLAFVPGYAAATRSAVGIETSGYSVAIAVNICMIAGSAMGISGDFMNLKSAASSRLVPMRSGIGSDSPSRYTSIGCRGTRSPSTTGEKGMVPGCAAGTPVNAFIVAATTLSVSNAAKLSMSPQVPPTAAVSLSATYAARALS